MSIKMGNSFNVLQYLGKTLADIVEVQSLPKKRKKKVCQANLEWKNFLNMNDGENHLKQ
jgi:hypothetical protein